MARAKTPVSFEQIKNYYVHPLPGYIADDAFDPVWEELNKRSAVVFLHGAQIPSSTPYPHPFLGIPIMEVLLIFVYYIRTGLGMRRR